MKVLLVDDEPLARARLRRLLSEWPELEIVGEAEDGEQAQKLCVEQNPDLVFLDIEMPNLDGLALAKRLALQPLPPAIAFVTAHPSHALDAIQSAPAGYLLKPVEEKALSQLMSGLGKLNRAHVEKHRTPNIRYQQGNVAASVELGNVYYFCADEKYVRMVFDKGQALIETSLKQLEQKYPADLLRIHRKYLINRTYIKSLHSSKEGAWLELHGVDEHLEVSRRAVKQVKSLLG